jgi:hypothetical protein
MSNLSTIQKICLHAPKPAFTSPPFFYCRMRAYNWPLIPTLKTPPKNPTGRWTKQCKKRSHIVAVMQKKFLPLCKILPLSGLALFLKNLNSQLNHHTHSYTVLPWIIWHQTNVCQLKTVGDRTGEFHPPKLSFFCSANEPDY